MANVPLTPLALEERALAPIWNNGVKSVERFDWYTRLIVDSGKVLGGRDTISEFVAAMARESSLDNLIVGNNAKNGSDNAGLGIGWCQLDTQWHVGGGLDGLHWLRSDPFISLAYVTDPANGLCKHGKLRTYFNKQRWHAWEPEIIDPKDGWSALAEAEAAYDRVVGTL